MRWRYRLWCPDCTGVDPDGCFEGGTELSEDTFETEQEAVAAAITACYDDSIWRYEIEKDNP